MNMTPGFDPFAGDELSDIASVTPEQEEIWLNVQLGGTPANLAYNQAIVLELRGELDRGALRRAFALLVGRHEALRSTVSPDGASLCILRDGKVAFHEAEVAAEVLGETLRRILVQPFDLVEGPLIRAHLLGRTGTEHVLVVMAHHLVADGWSLGVIGRELGALYGAEARGLTSRLAEPPSFVEYAALRASEDSGAGAEAALSFFREHLTPLPPPLDLPLDFSRPLERTFDADRVDHALPRQLVVGLKQLGVEHGASIAATLIAGFTAFLHRITGQSPIVIALPVAGQSIAGANGLVGHCVRALPIPFEVNAEASFSQHLACVRSRLLESVEHPEASFGRIVEALRVPRDASRIPLAPVMFNVDQDAGPPVFEGLEVHASSPRREYESFELFPNAVVEGDRIELQTQFKTGLFERGTVARRLAELQALLESAVSDPSRLIGALEVMPAVEKRWALGEINRTQADAPSETVVGLFTRSVATFPDRPCVTSAVRTLTYSDLERESAAVTARLIAAGIGPGDLVGVSLARSVDLLAALLGVLRSGAAYVPLDPEYPEERLAFIEQDARLRAVLTERALAARFRRSVEVLLVEDSRDLLAPVIDRSEPASPAYVIYTSGSTGKPKGVVVDHRNVTNFLSAMAKEPGIRPEDVLVAVTTPSFDISVLELFLPLTVGARVVVATREQVTTGALLGALLEESGATLLQATPSGFRLLLEAGWSGKQDLKVLVGGEALTPELAASLAPRTAGVWNCYGPTETTVWSLVEPVRGGAITIGRPIANTSLYALDGRGRPVAPGVVGELFIGGAGVTRGYLRRPELTRERFVDDPFSSEPGARLYKTGDLVRLRWDGRFEWLGRSDFQVKLRGHRIELPELEARAREVPGVLEAVAIVREDRPSDQRLVLYVRWAEGATQTEEAVLALLRAALPAYMVPQHVVTLWAVPKTPNGKVDRSALPAPEGPLSTSRDPETETERGLAEDFQQLLGVLRVGVEDDFFGLGGHSLLVQRLGGRVRARFGVDLPMRVVFSSPTVLRLAEFVDKAIAAAQAAELGVAPGPDERSVLASTRVDEEELALVAEHPLGSVAPLSPAQMRLWFQEQLSPGSPLLNIPVRWRLLGSLDLDALTFVVAELGRRHDALRIRLETRNGEVVQSVDPADLRLVVRDLSALPLEVRGRSFEAESAAFARDPIPLQGADLVRFRLFRLSPEEHVLAVVGSHVVFDGSSQDLVLHDLQALYAARTTGAPLPEPPRFRFRDVARFQRERAQAQAADRSADVEYFRQRLAGMPEHIELSTDWSRPISMSHQGTHVAFPISGELLGRLRQVARGQGATLNMLALASIEIVMARHSGQADFGIGMPVHGRRRADFENVVGMFVDTLILRSEVPAGGRFVDLLGRVRDTTLEALQHQALPFDQLVHELSPERERGRTPLFQVMLSHQRRAGGDGQRSSSGLRAVELPTFAASALTDVTFWLFEHDDRAVIAVETASDIFDPETAARFCGSWRRLLAAIAERPEAEIDALPVIGEESERNLLYGFNGPVVAWDTTALVHHLFERAADARPDAVALVALGEEVTFRELDTRANRLARVLVSHGVGSDARVAVCLPRTVDLVVALLAVLKAGGAYVPLDPTFPSDRLAYVVADSAAEVLVTNRELGLVLGSGAPTVLVDGDSARILAEAPGRLPVSGRSSQLAYVLYTSGSTGRPKGVMVEHGNVVSFLIGMEHPVRLDDTGVWLSGTTLAFDMSVIEIWGSLCYGRKVILLGETVLGAVEDAEFSIPSLVARHGVTHFQCTPTQCRILLLGEEGRRALGSLRQLIVGGEALAQDLADELAELVPGQVINGYGPTETTVFSTTDEVRSGEPVTIGRPIANALAFVLDPAGRLVPVGALGELYLGGPGVTRGYLGRPELTAERFVPNRIRPDAGDRLYRTGDLVRHGSDGKLWYLGRNDQQVKIRGFRVELGEIETLLRKHPGVDEVAVIARGEAALKVLIAYVVPSAAYAGDEATRARLRSQIPDYMVPAIFVHMEALPQTPNGKLDRKALPEPPSTLDSGTVDGAPKNHVERALMRLWSEALGAERLGANDDFFALGGHSLLAVRLFNDIHTEFGLRLPLSALFERPTIRKLGALIEERGVGPDGGSGAHWTTVVPIQPAGSLPPLFCVAGLGGNPMNLVHLARTLGEQQPLYGLQHRGVDGELAPHRSIRAMAEEFVADIRKIQRRGPYYLGGYSSGGLAAYGMAALLLAQGEKVAMVVLLDTSNPEILEWSVSERIRAHVENLKRIGPRYVPLRAKAMVERKVDEVRRTVRARLGGRYRFEYRHDEVVEATLVAERTYEPPPLDVDVCLVKAEADVMGVGGIGYPAHESNGWRQLVRGRLDIALVHGNHQDLVSERVAPDTARAILEGLEAARRRAADRMVGADGQGPPASRRSWSDGPPASVPASRRSPT